METAFSPEVSRSWKCQGRRHWLATQAEICDLHPRVLQRGASNLYFPVSQSSLLIPPWDDLLEQRLGDRWPDILEVEPAERAAAVRRLLERGRIEIPPDWDREIFIQRVVSRAALHDGIQPVELREEEWHRFVQDSGIDEQSRDFEIRPEIVPDAVRSCVGSVARVVRLRELRALQGFTRINPPPAPDDIGQAMMASLSVQAYRWLPAVEVRGEGVFIALADEAVRAWERRPSVVRRIAVLNEAYREEFRSRFGADETPKREITPRFILAHTFAHAVIRQLSLECGYSSASLRERIYASSYGCGALIYTATTDADGTLGGLQRQGRVDRLEGTLLNAIIAQDWCSSDPLCITGAMMSSNDTNLAACHACLLAAETSCEEYNRFLDRAVLVGSSNDPEIGFFTEWLGR